MSDVAELDGLITEALPDPEAWEKTRPMLTKSEANVYLYLREQLVARATYHADAASRHLRLSEAHILRCLRSLEEKGLLELGGYEWGD